MRVLHLIDSGGFYGAEVMLLHLMAVQVQLGLTPILASMGERGVPEKSIEAAARQRGLTVKPFRMRAGFNLAGALRVLDFARAQQVSVLHSHGYKGNILFGTMPCWLRRLPMVATVHGWTWAGGISRMMVYEWLDSLCLRRADAVVVVNEAMTSHPRLRSIRPHRLHTINNGIPQRDTLDQASRPKLPQPILDFVSQGTCIVALGRLSAEKGFDILFKAVAGLVLEGRDVRLVLLGVGPLREELQQLAEQLGIGQRVLLPGFLADAPRLLNYFDIFALPSLTEGLPMVVLEAMQAGLPIVASKVGGIPQVLDHGACGLLTPAGDVQAVRTGLRDIMENKERAADRVRAAKARVHQLYSSRTMAEGYLTVYKRVQGDPGKGCENDPRIVC